MTRHLPRHLVTLSGQQVNGDDGWLWVAFAKGRGFVIQGVMVIAQGDEVVEVV